MNFIKIMALIHCYGINLILNIFPFFMIDIFYDNMSYIGNELHHPIYLLLWSMSSALGFYFLSLKIWKKTSIPMPTKFHTVFCLGMVLSCLIPYSAEGFVILNDLHVWIAIICVAGFIGEWLWYFYWRVPLSFWEKILLFVLAICVLLLLIPGHITASTEIAFSALVQLVLYQLAFSHKHATIKP